MSTPSEENFSKKLDAIEIAISKDRFTIYTDATNGDRQRAFILYEWNKAVSGAFYCLLQETEVVFRNTVHSAMTQRYGKYWYDNPEAGLDSKTLGLIAEAKKNTHDYASNPDHLVPCLTFGFWVNLLGAGSRSEDVNYEMTLWRPALSSAFPKGLTRKKAYQPILNLRILRNRIAHQESIFMRDLERDYKDILTVLNWLSPEVADWISSATRLPALLSDRNSTDKIMF